MKGKPAGQEHDFYRDEGYSPPGYLAKKSQSNAGKDIGAGCAAVSQNGLAGLHHMGSIRVVARQLQSVVGFYATTEVEVPPTVKIPATVFTLVFTKINSDFGREFIVDLIHIVHHKDVLGRDGAVGL